MALYTNTSEKSKEKLKLISYRETGKSNMGLAIELLIKMYEKKNKLIEIK